MPNKWGKYLKRYKKQWETDKRVKDWLQPSSESDVMKGKPEAFCKVCESHLRAHLNDLVAHSQTPKHKANALKFNRRVQPTLQNFGCVKISDSAKYADLKLAVFTSCHTSVNTIDHLGEILNELGKGSPLENVRLHRTKCSKLISNVIAPAFLTELIQDIGDSPYSLIMDECTDISVTKFMGICVRYYSKLKKKMVSDFLGLIQVTGCTGKELADATKEYLKVIGLPLKNLQAIGTDGAPNMCGIHNSLYTHLKADVPDLMIFKCVCHSIDKCAEHAFKSIPSELSDLLHDANNWFSHKVKGWDEYKQYYKAMNAGKEPKKLISLSLTRWLVWLPATEIIYDQWYELRGFFNMKGEGTKGDKKAEAIGKLFNSSNLLYVVFLKTLLHSVQKVNKAFEHTDADITKLYTDLRSLVLSLAGRILKPQCMAEVARPGMLRRDEARVLQGALANPENLLTTDRVNLGDSFLRTARAEKVPEQTLNDIRRACGEYIFTLCRMLLEKLPSNLDAVSKLRFLTPRLTLAKVGRPTFQQLPIEMAGKNVNRDALERQWLELGFLSLTEICEDAGPDTQQEEIDIVHFWSSVLNCQNAGGERPFQDLALFALKVLTLPISNAVVERVFSVMSCIKARRRNRLQLLMLEALMRIRIHLKVDGLCCKQFKPTADMIRKFTSAMYLRHHENDNERVQCQLDRPSNEGDQDYDPDDPLAVGDIDGDGGNGDIVVLEDEDYRIVAMIDATDVDESLFLV